MFGTIVTLVVGAVIGFAVGVLVYRNNASLFEKKMAPYLDDFKKFQGSILAELEELKKKLPK